MSLWRPPDHALPSLSAPSPCTPPKTHSLQESYLECLGKCGGLHEARPKTLLDMLQPRFPFLTLQVREGVAQWRQEAPPASMVEAVPAAAGVASGACAAVCPSPTICLPPHPLFSQLDMTSHLQPIQ